jgi:hypothetical protein
MLTQPVSYQKLRAGDAIRVVATKPMLKKPACQLHTDVRRRAANALGKQHARSEQHLSLTKDQDAIDVILPLVVEATSKDADLLAKVRPVTMLIRVKNSRCSPNASSDLNSRTCSSRGQRNQT